MNVEKEFLNYLFYLICEFVQLVKVNALLLRKENPPYKITYAEHAYLQSFNDSQVNKVQIP
jgi:hypothetical protein